MKKHYLIPLILLSSCAGDNYITFNGFEQGTTYTVVARNPSPDTGEKIDGLFDEIDKTFSMFNPASLTSRINRNETASTTPLFDECFAMAKSVHNLTEGYYDPTVKPLVDAWGFGPGEQQEVPCVECLMEYVDFDKITIEPVGTLGGENRIIKSDPRVGLDFSSIAKGFTVDKLAELLEAEGAADYMVEVGGEVRVRGNNPSGKPWRIGIDKPSSDLGAREMEAVVSLGGDLHAIATSGNYRNTFVDEAGRRRVHTIDPLTGLPAEGEILSVSIVAPTCVAADAWATGIMASGTLENARRLLENARRLLANSPAGIEHYIIYSNADGTTASLHSPGFPLEE